MHHPWRIRPNALYDHRVSAGQAECCLDLRPIFEAPRLSRTLALLLAGTLSFLLSAREEPCEIFEVAGFAGLSVREGNWHMRTQDRERGLELPSA